MDEHVSHVLYVSMDCKVCHALRGRGIPYGVRLEDVMGISPRPAWLDGTPTLVDVSVGVLYKGSDALIVLEHMRQTQAYQPEPPPSEPPSRPTPQGPSVPSRPSPQSFSRPAAPMQPPQAEPPQPQLRPANAPSNGSAVPWTSLFTEELPLAVDEKPSKITESSIADMMSRRAAQIPVNKPGA